MKHALRLLLLSTLLWAGLAEAQVPAPAASAVVPARPARPPFPQLNLPERKSQGARAIELLGDRLPEVAAWYGKSPEEFRSMMLRDRRLRLDQRGRLFVEDELEVPLPASTPSSAASGALNGSLAPLDQTFLLHSRAGAKRTIYLNFRGAQVSSTAWNGSTTTLSALPFDIDGIPYTFSTAELERIQYIWQRVVEDYAPFDVDVTTEPPAPERLTRSGSADDVFGTTVLVTSRSGVYSCNCGGVAYIGIFDDTSDYYKPALVFYDALGSGDEKYVAEAISHEAGHNMGLQHDGTSDGSSYYAGQGSGATGWAPIMGVGYYQALVQWSKGEYTNANNVQDDYLVMQSNGLPLRADDHGNTPATATVLVGNSSGGLSSYYVEGVIERPDDIDMFAIASGAGTASISVSPAARSPNLDALLELRNSAGTLLASANPVDALPASLTVTLPAAGTYYVSVQGTGKGDPLTTGYSKYGSLGQYALAATVPVPAGQPPLVTLAATPTSGTVPFTVNFSSAGSSDPDGSIVAYEWNFGDGSATASGASASHVYSTAGTYNAALKITDNTGLTTSKAVTITAKAAVTLVPMGVGDIAMSLSTSRRNASASAAVTVRDSSGALITGATVTGRWSGVVTGNVSAVTGSNGVARLVSSSTRSSGTFVFTVTGVTLSGYTYQSSLNAETSDSITR